MYELICASTQGADHIKHGIPCEDYGQVFESELCKIFAVADGHGDSNCPRSQFGSKTACELAISEMEKFCSDIKENAWESRIISPGKELDSLAHQLISSIVAKWVKSVNEELENNPLTDGERAGCEKYIERYDKGERLEHIYGTTLIAGLITEKYLLLIQQGDGRCVVFNADGSASQPIPWDEKCFANITTSLCDEDAIQRFRYCTVNLNDNPLVACLVGSDGVEDSYLSMDLMHSYYRDLLVYASENGTAALNEYLGEALSEFSKQGSGDDVTISGIVDSERVLNFVDAFKRDNEIVRKESVIREIDERLKSMNGMGKMDALKSKYDRAMEEVEKAEKSHAEAIEKLNSYVLDFQQLIEAETDGSEKFKVWNRLMDSIFPGNRVEALKKKIADLQAIVEQTKQRLDKAKDDLVPAEREYKEFMARKEAYEKEKVEVEQQLAELQNS
jgi:hypothetical protein